MLTAQPYCAIPAVTTSKLSESNTTFTLEWFLLSFCSLSRWRVVLSLQSAPRFFLNMTILCQLLRDGMIRPGFNMSSFPTTSFYTAYFFMTDFIFNHVYVYTCLYMWVQVPTEARRRQAPDCLGAGITRGCESPSRMLRTNLGPLQEGYASLTTEPFRHLCLLYFFCGF